MTADGNQTKRGEASTYCQLFEVIVGGTTSRAGTTLTHVDTRRVAHSKLVISLIGPGMALLGAS